MKKYHVTTIYFSPTENSKKSVNEIAKEIDLDFEQMNLTRLDQKPSGKIFSEEELVVFGAPVYGGRLYKGAAAQLKQIKGNHTPCIIVVTYGNRAYDDALLELKDLVKENGFIPVAAAALVGEHTFGQIQMGRPDEKDFLQDKNFAADVIHKLDTDDTEVEVPGNFPYTEGGDGAGFRPSTTADCISCGLCAKLCPQQAIRYEDYKTIDTNKCISCFSCIKHCPVQAKIMESKEYDKFAEDFSKKLEKRCENEYFN